MGATNNLKRRVREHKEGKYTNAFTKRYNCYPLVYFEEFENLKDAFNRERKEDLTHSLNPEWKDLSESWFDRDEDSK